MNKIKRKSSETRISDMGNEEMSQNEMREYKPTRKSGSKTRDGTKSPEMLLLVHTSQRMPGSYTSLGIHLCILLVGGCTSAAVSELQALSSKRRAAG